MITKSVFIGLVVFVISDARADEVASIATKPKSKWQYRAGGIEIPAATAGEPFVADFGIASLQAAKKYLDDGALAWTRERSCIACHTTGVYMAERPALTMLIGKPSEEVWRDFVASVTDPVFPSDKNADEVIRWLKAI